MVKNARLNKFIQLKDLKPRHYDLTHWFKVNEIPCDEAESSDTSSDDDDYDLMPSGVVIEDPNPA